MNHYFKIITTRFALILAIFSGTLLPFQTVQAASLYDRKAVTSDYPLWDEKTYGGSCGTEGGGSPTPGGDNPEKIWNYMLAKTTPFKLEPYQIAGVMGNMQSESGFDPTIIQDGGNSNNPADAGSLGYGLVQWTPGAKLIPYLNGQPPSIETEIDALYAQLAGVGPSPEKRAGDALLASQNVDSAAFEFETKYERHAGPPQPDRITQARAILQQYGNGAPSSGPGSGPGITPVPGDTPPAVCGPGNNAQCTTGDNILDVPAGGVGVKTCYFNQSDIFTTGDTYNWALCGCMPTSTLMIRATLENKPDLAPIEVLNGIRAHNGVSPDCGAQYAGVLDYIRSVGYGIEEIVPWKGTTTDDSLVRIKQALTQGKLVMAHTSTYVDSTKNEGSPGHYLVVHAVDGAGNFYVANPGARSDNNKPVSPATMKSWLDGFWAIGK